MKYGRRWCGALVGANVSNQRGFVLAYAHHGRGVIVYDGLNADQVFNVAYRQYAARQLLLPFDPDSLPARSWRRPSAASPTS